MFVFGTDLIERDHEEDVDLGGRIILQWIFNERDGEVWTGLIRLNITQVAGNCECGNKPSDSIKCGVFLE